METLVPCAKVHVVWHWTCPHCHTDNPTDHDITGGGNAQCWWCERVTYLCEW